MPRGTTVLALLLLAAGPLVAQVTPPTPVINAGESSYDNNPGEVELREHPSVTYGSVLLTADEIHYSESQHLVSGFGHFVVTFGARRLLADSGTYHLVTGIFTLKNIRAGEPPYYLQAASATGTRERMTLTDATVSFNEPGSLAPTLRAAHLIYEPGHLVTGLQGHLGLGDLRLFPLPSFSQNFREPLISHLTARVGYRHNLGAYLDLGLHVPVWPGINLGGDVGEYTARGIMAGPGADYDFPAAGGEATGTLSSGFISDHGDRSTDLLGRPVPQSRAFVDWRHYETVGDRLTLMGQISWWKDSEVMRDFHPTQFFAVQQPDSFLEADYAGANYYLSAFTRLDPNNFQMVQQRLPEIRFDLLPTAIGGGFYERFNSSYAALQEDSLFSGPTLRSDRFDAYYALERPLMPTNWLTITPVAGGRLTYYAKAVGGRSDYTRWLGELGFDAQLRASGVFSYQNKLWGIDGLRHLLTPGLSYRYIPEGDRGQPYIPMIDRTVFSTELQPIDLGAVRNLDELHATNTLRFSLDNLLQTRDPHYGSRDLVRFDLASDLAFSPQAGQHHWSDVYTQLTLTPAPWMRFSLYQRIDPRTFALHELNTSLDLVDQDWWTVRFASSYLQGQIEEYLLEYDRRLNEVWKSYARTRYDALKSRWDEIAVGLRQNVRNTWNIRYEVSWYQGRQRESSFGVNIAVDLIRF